MDEGQLIVLQLYCAACGGEMDIDEDIAPPFMFLEMEKGIRRRLRCQDCRVFLEPRHFEGILEAMEQGLFA